MNGISALQNLDTFPVAVEPVPGQAAETWKMTGNLFDDEPTSLEMIQQETEQAAIPQETAVHVGHVVLAGERAVLGVGSVDWKPADPRLRPSYPWEQVPAQAAPRTGQQYLDARFVEDRLLGRGQGHPNAIGQPRSAVEQVPRFASFPQPTEKISSSVSDRIW